MKRVVVIVHAQIISERLPGKSIIKLRGRCEDLKTYFLVYKGSGNEES